MEEEIFYSVDIGDHKHMCVGAVWPREVEKQQDLPAYCDGFGIYLFVMDMGESKEKTILAKFVDRFAARDCLDAMIPFF